MISIYDFAFKRNETVSETSQQIISSKDSAIINQPGQEIYAPQTVIGGRVVGHVLSGQIGTVIIQPVQGPSTISVPSQIPEPPADFTGREKEIEDLHKNFNQGAAITGIRGLGGIGKTALALVLAEKVACRYPDGQLFIELQGTSKKPLAPEEAMAQVIRAYLPEAKLPEGESEMAGRYRSVLAGKRALILLDNAANRDQVEPLLPPPGCAVIITSRNKFALPILAVNDLDVLPLEDSKKLLLAIAARIGNYAEELARLCGCLPIALRNAAYILAERKDLGVEEYLNRLKNVRKRQDLVEASFSLSYELLNPEQQKLWCMLSAFPADFDRAGAAAIWIMDSNSAADVLSDLFKLSLLEYQEAAGRYHLHDLARDFASSRLDEGAKAEAQQRHAEYYMNLLATADELCIQGGKSILDGLQRFDLEETNIRAGQAWAEKTMAANSSALALCSYYPDAGAYVLDLRLHPRERIAWRKTALSAARQLKDRSAEAVHLGSLGQAYANLGEPRKAIEHFEQALEIARLIGDKRGEGVRLGSLGQAYADLGEPRKAIEHFEQALEIARLIGDKRNEGVWLGNLGQAYAALGEPRKAIEHFEQALEIARLIGDKRGEGASLGNLGQAYAALGEPRKAIEHFEQALDIARQIGDKRNEGALLGNLGQAYAAIGEPRKAIEHFEQALDIARQIGDKRGEGVRLGSLGLAFYKLDQRERAIECTKAALTIFEQIESPYAELARKTLAQWQGDEKPI